jgi:hypothetical protein
VGFDCDPGNTATPRRTVTRLSSETGSCSPLRVESPAPIHAFDHRDTQRTDADSSHRSIDDTEPNALHLDQSTNLAHPRVFFPAAATPRARQKTPRRRLSSPCLPIDVPVLPPRQTLLRPPTRRNTLAKGPPSILAGSWPLTTVRTAARTRGPRPCANPVRIDHYAFSDLSGRENTEFLRSPTVADVQALGKNHYNPYRSVSRSFLGAGC